MREKFEAWAKDFVKGRDSNDRYTSPYTQAAWEGWQAALSAKQPSVSLDAGDLKRALDFAAPDLTADELETPITIQYIPDGHSGPGYYVHCTEYPEEGCELISTPSP